MNPENTLLYQFHAQKALFLVPKICNILLDWNFSENSSDLVLPSVPCSDIQMRVWNWILRSSLRLYRREVYSEQIPYFGAYSLPTDLTYYLCLQLRKTHTFTARSSPCSSSSKTSSPRSTKQMSSWTTKTLTRSKWLGPDYPGRAPSPWKPHWHNFMEVQFFMNGLKYLCFFVR